MDIQMHGNQLPTPLDTPSHPGDDDQHSPASHPNHSTTWTPVDSITPISTNPSRKRSRDETAFETDGDGSYFPSQHVKTPAPIPEEPQSYGEGMAVINPQTGLSVSTESQTGARIEEKAPQAASIPPPFAEFRPSLPSSRKSVRLSQSSGPIFTTIPSLSNAPASPPKSAPIHPEVDEATLALGIGWTKIASEDADIQAAARGWSRYIENHHRNIHGAEILLKSSGLNAYLVGCQDGYYLFREDLLEGKLVGKSWETCLINLRAGPMTFEGEETLRAERTPGPEERNVNGSGVMRRLQTPAVEKMENWAEWHRLNSEDRKGDVVVEEHGRMEVD